MTPATHSPAVQVGVLLARRPAELGEWLADATAFEAAGAAALWVDPAPDAGLDPLVLLAALAALTSRALLVAAPPTDRPPEALAGTLATVGRLSHGRLALVTAPDRLEELTAVAPGCERFRRLPATPAAFERMRGDGEAERWVQAAPPDSRAAWQSTLAAAADGGAAGLLVPAGPRLLDILRHPDDPGGRQDLQIAQG
ncbi:MAG TPA: LLM class flavin-dependent oxidoreductase [Actinomycetota bacterium]|nr:LLM class flavin-dependent oxidoreductase [Actinomycetota bacterium]